MGHSNFFDKASAKNIFEIDIKEDEILSVFPEEVIPKLYSESSGTNGKFKSKILRHTIHRIFH